MSYRCRGIDGRPCMYGSHSMGNSFVDDICDYCWLMVKGRYNELADLLTQA